MAREHGTRSRYTAGCRCEACTTANREDGRHRERQILYGRWQPYVDARAAREHLEALGRYGIGWRQAAKLAGVSTGTVSHLLFGKGERTPTRQVRAATQEKILAVRAVPENAASSALVDATGTRRRLEALVAAGWPASAVARRLGWGRDRVRRAMRQQRVIAATAVEVRAAYDEIWDKPCPARTPGEREGIRRAVAYARQMGWAPPMAWDDEEIDSPRARPRGVRRDEAA